MVLKPESAVRLAPLTLGASVARGCPADGGGSTGEVATVEDSESGALDDGGGGVKLLMLRWRFGSLRGSHYELCTRSGLENDGRKQPQTGRRVSSNETDERSVRTAEAIQMEGRGRQEAVCELDKADSQTC